MCHKTSISARCRWSTRFTKASTQPSLAVPAPMDAAKWSPWWLEVVCRVSLMTLKCSCINLAIRLSRQKVWSNGCRPCHWVQKEELPLGSAEGDLGSNPPILRTWIKSSNHSQGAQGLGKDSWGSKSLVGFWPLVKNAKVLETKNFPPYSSCLFLGVQREIFNPRMF